MKPLHRTGLVIAALGICAVPAVADPIVLDVGTGSFVSVRLCPPEGGGCSFKQDLNRDYLNVSLLQTLAQLRTNVDSSHFTASGRTAAVVNDRQTAEAEAMGSVRYGIRPSERLDFDLTLNISEYTSPAHGYSEAGWSTMVFWLKDPNADERVMFGQQFFEAGSFHFSGRLPAVAPSINGLSIYEFFVSQDSVSAFGSTPTSIRYDLNLALRSVSPVPEPGSLMLAASGLLAAGAQLWRRKQHQR